MKTIKVKFVPSELEVPVIIGWEQLSDGSMGWAIASNGERFVQYPDDEIDDDEPEWGDEVTDED